MQNTKLAWDSEFGRDARAVPLVLMAIESVGRDTVMSALTDALEPVAQADGSVRLDNVFKVVIAGA